MTSALQFHVLDLCVSTVEEKVHQTLYLGERKTTSPTFQLVLNLCLKWKKRWNLEYFCYFEYVLVKKSLFLGTTFC